MWNEEQAISYIRAYKWTSMSPGLDRIRELLERLGRPQDRLRFVHVAGTNGKGSACAMLASVFREAGYRTGLFTSPDLVHFEERMVVDGRMITPERLAEVVENLSRAADAMEDHPSEFELLTAAALRYFAEEACDIVILEVGLGGELDSTNVIDSPEAALIMNIGLEHTQFLGTTLQEIARAKAGIIKAGTTAVCYPVPEEVRQVFRETCEATGADLREADLGRLSPGKIQSGGKILQSFLWDGEPYELSLAGANQLKNAAVVLTAVEALRERGWTLPQEAVRRALADTVWPARFEVLETEPCLIADGSHNVQCIEALVTNLKTYFPEKTFTFVLGILADKDYHTMTELLLPLAERFVCVTPDNPRALPAEELAEGLRHEGAEAVAVTAETPEEAYSKALQLAGCGRRDVVLCGSLYLVGRLRERLVSGKAAETAAFSE